VRQRLVIADCTPTLSMRGRERETAFRTPGRAAQNRQRDVFGQQVFRGFFEQVEAF